MAGVIETRDIHLRQMSTLLDAIAQRADISTAGITFTRSLKDTSVYLRSQMVTRFRDQMSPDGVPWKPLKRPRRRKRDKKRNRRADGSSQGGQKVLWDKGILAGSAGGKANQKPDIDTVAAMWLEQGSNLYYAGFHQDGTRHIPARPFAGITDKDVEKIEMFIADSIVAQLTGGR